MTAKEALIRVHLQLTEKSENIHVYKKQNMRDIKNYCKEMKIKFEQNTDSGFIGSWTVDVKAGMEKDLDTGRFISLPIRTIGKKRVYYEFICHSDNDIEMGKKLSALNLSK